MIKTYISKLQNFVKATKTSGPMGYSGATSSLLIGKNCMYIETSSINPSSNVLRSYEQNDVFQIGHITFYYYKLSISTNDSLKSMGRFRIQLLLADSTWSTRYNISKTDRYGNTPTQWTKLSLYFTVENYGVR